MSDEKQSWYDRLTAGEQAILMAAVIDAEKLILDPDSYWDVNAAELAEELREAAVCPEVSSAMKRIELLRLADKVARLEGRPGTRKFHEWKEGAKASATIAHRPRDVGHTEEFFVAHRDRYLESAAKDGAYAAGADCVASAILATQRNSKPLSLCTDAIKYVLDRAQTNREFGWHTGSGTEAFRRLVLAEAAILGVDFAEHEKKRIPQYWPEENS